MEFSIANIFLAIGAGLASVLSPCVLPVVPVIAAGGAEKKDRLRPLLIVLGLSITFMSMGAVSSLLASCWSDAPGSSNRSEERSSLRWV